ncbi:MAG: hypothetical protein K2M91_03250, partial [Lachnospiraceae bacterium]|nr:hypothetical protein [Lachnospiraceae bacterium]
MSGLKLTELDPLLDLIEVELEGVSNGYLTQFFRTIIGCDIEVCGEVEKRYSCPCCGYKTLDEIYDSSKGTGYDICPYCNWEDDGTTDISAQTSINHGSIQDYRDKIKNNPNKYYICLLYT